MNLIKASILLALSSLTGSGSAMILTKKEDVFTPTRISHERLSANPLHVPNESLLLDSLSTDGFLAITDIPGFGSLKRDLMAHLHGCLLEQGDAFPRQTMNDGTVRRTIGTVTLPGNRQNGHGSGAAAQPIAWKSSDFDSNLSPSCQNFSKNLDAFRATVDETTITFAKRLSFEMGSSLSSPLMTTQDGSHSFNDIKDIVSSGEHLEHFHSYQKIANYVSSEQHQHETMDLHLDQGFFIAFTPGLMVSHHAEGQVDLSKPLVESEGFYVEFSDGKRSLIQFDASDDLIFLMGDGANQYINNQLHNDSTSQQKRLRAAPHAVSLKTHTDSLARVWYGRMVLPPKEAYIPSTDQTYGDVRDHLSSLKDGERQAGVGCSSYTMRAFDAPTVVRVLSATSAADNTTSSNHDDSGHSLTSNCEEGSLYCWFRCMDLETHGVSEDICAAQNLNLQCINPREQFSDGKKHGDYYPACSNTTDPVTPYPTLPEFPQDAETCTQAKWDEFTRTGDYDHAFNMTTDKTASALQWSVTDEEKISARLAFNGQFGWLSFGFLNLDPDAGHNGMNGANVILALPGDKYTAKDGLDMTGDHNIGEYMISNVGSSFRHWQTATTRASSDFDAQVDYDGCFTSISYTLDNIRGEAFNINGKDHLLWAGNPMDTHVGYHLKHRAVFTVEWSKGKAYFGREEPEQVVPDDNTSSSGASSFPMTTIATLATIFISFFF